MGEKRMEDERISVETTVSSTIDKVWKLWTQPEHIVKWNNASADWYTPSAVNDLRAGGVFSYKMAAKDGSYQFDFGGIYDEDIDRKKIMYTLGDGRKAEVEFTETEGGVRVEETFDKEKTNPMAAQRAGWQAILDHFKSYAEMN
jgi:uncharacterized protein YndB with AHSA1/START domain